MLSNVALHHLPDIRAALDRLGQLVRPGGTLAIVGFARTGRLGWPWAAEAFISLGIANRLHGKWEHTAPQSWPPRETFGQLRHSATNAPRHPHPPSDHGPLPAHLDTPADPAGPSDRHASHPALPPQHTKP